LSRRSRRRFALAFFTRQAQSLPHLGRRGSLRTCADLLAAGG
jgi:hypothetical protein